MTVRRPRFFRACPTRSRRDTKRGSKVTNLSWGSRSLAPTNTRSPRRIAPLSRPLGYRTWRSARVRPWEFHEIEVVALGTLRDAIEFDWGPAASIAMRTAPRTHGGSRVRPQSPAIG